MALKPFLLLFIFLLINSSAQMRLPFDPVADNDEVGTRWAILVAGSNGFVNYRHQADVCHAYQILKKGGLKDENIVVFMYDDIANNVENPRPGIIINHPDGTDVYAGVPKDYTGEQVTAENFYAVLLGNRTALTGGSGKVVNSKPEDRIFVYYSDHGAPGLLSLPSGSPIYANDLTQVLKMKHAANGYKEMVMYIEACNSGSIFEGILPTDINVYVTTASNADESSYTIYCADDLIQPPPPEYHVCLGDLYSVAWMEDSETHNLKEETIEQQYENVKERTGNAISGSHVMEYGSMSIKPEKLDLYQGFDTDSDNFPGTKNLRHETQHMNAINQRDADLLPMWLRYKKSKLGSEENTDGMKQLIQTMKHRVHVDGSVSMIGTILFGPKDSNSILNSVRAAGLPIVDDWDCLKSMVRTFETHCGSLTQYGMKHTRAFANLCNKNVSIEEMQRACAIVCHGLDV